MKLDDAIDILKETCVDGGIDGALIVNVMDGIDLKSLSEEDMAKLATVLPACHAVRALKDWLYHSEDYKDQSKPMSQFLDRNPGVWIRLKNELKPA